MSLALVALGLQRTSHMIFGDCLMFALPPPSGGNPLKKRPYLTVSFLENTLSTFMLPRGLSVLSFLCHLLPVKLYAQSNIQTAVECTVCAPQRMNPGFMDCVMLCFRAPGLIADSIVVFSEL